jgi:hypothetical protein
MNFNRPPVDCNVSCYRCCGSGLITMPYSGGWEWHTEPCPECNGTGKAGAGEGIMSGTAPGRHR